jgi:hypothetical protein
MTKDEYIEHEVKLRVHDHKFKMLEAKLNFIIGLGISGVILPVLLHWAKFI